MKRRSFLGSLFAVPVAAKAVAEDLPVKLETTHKQVEPAVVTCGSAYIDPELVHRTAFQTRIKALADDLEANPPNYHKFYK